MNINHTHMLWKAFYKTKWDAHENVFFEFHSNLSLGSKTKSICFKPPYVSSEIVNMRNRGRGHN